MLLRKDKSDDMKERDGQAATRNTSPDTRMSATPKRKSFPYLSFSLFSSKVMEKGVICMLARCMTAKEKEKASFTSITCHCSCHFKYVKALLWSLSICFLILWSEYQVLIRPIS